MPVRSRRATRLKWTALIVCVVLAIIGALLGLRGPMLHVYEYQEDVYLALNGSASVYVSGSIPALVALYGLDLSIDPRAPIDRDKLRAAFSGPGVSVGSIATWRRAGRRFVTLRVDTTDVRKLPGAAPWASNAYEYGRVKAGYRLREHVGPSANKRVGDIGWDGSELVGYRWHLPAKIEGNNTREENFLRGNILVWEQPLAARLAGVPLDMWVEMQGQSILYGTLWLFATSAGAALVLVALVLGWIVRKGKPRKTVTARQ
jgi:hypothetical protein